MLHAAGLSDATDEEMHAYEIYRSQVAWNTRFLDERRHWSFTKWIWRVEKPILLIAIVGIVLCFWPLRMQPASTALAQAIVVFLFLMRVRDPLIDPNNRDDAETARMFHRCWCALLAAWVVFYLMLFWTKIDPSSLPEGAKNPPYGPREVTIQFLDNLNTCFLLFCYFVLRDPPSLVSERAAQASSWTSLQRKGVCLTGVFVILTVADVIWTWQGWYEKFFFSRWIGGAVGGVALALLIGRLESKTINAPIGVIALLYFYAVLQGVMIDYGGVSEVEDFMFLLALALKSLLVLFLNWVLASERLTLYIHRLRILEKLRREADERLENVVLESD
jgi:hypothetical protein